MDGIINQVFFDDSVCATIDESFRVDKHSKLALKYGLKDQEGLTESF